MSPIKKIILTGILVLSCFVIIIFGLYHRFLSTEQRYSLPPSALIEETPSSPAQETTPALLEVTGVNQETRSYKPITTIEEVFTTPTFGEDDSSIISLLATGDVLTARTVNYKMRQLHDFTWPFKNTHELTRSADITYINLETPLIANCPTKTDGMIFCGDLKSVEGLTYAGIDVINIANNHASNQGSEGVLETVKTLTDAQFKVSGQESNNASYVTSKNTTFAFLGFNEVNIQDGVTTATDQAVHDEITNAKEKADIVIVQFHWGNEYTRKPSSNQKRLARLAIDSGADLIIGNHPHWFQPIEFYKEKLIVYSHGNFVFDQMWSKETREGIVGKYYFADKKLVGVIFTPIVIENYGQPKIASEDEGEKIIDELKSESRELSSSN